MSPDTAAPPRTNTERWLDLERERRSLESRLRSIVSTQEHLRLAILERWSLDGTRQEKVDGYTLYLRRALYPKVANLPALVTALQEAGLSDLLTVDPKPFSMYVTTCDEEGRPLPESIAAHLDAPHERFALAVKLK
jgi:hypothetical protein